MARSRDGSGGRFLWLIALERSLRGVLLLAAGIYLLANAGADFGSIANHLARAIELDPEAADRAATDDDLKEVR